MLSGRRPLKAVVMPFVVSEIGMNSEPDRDLLWKQYELHVGLYKHYLELVLKFNVFYYAATGAILSYFFSKTDVPLIKYSLLFPIIMSLGFAILFIYGAFAL